MLSINCVPLCICQATSIEDLKKCDAIISCQGGDYTNEVFPKLRAAGDTESNPFGLI